MFCPVDTFFSLSEAPPFSTIRESRTNVDHVLHLLGTPIPELRSDHTPDPWSLSPLTVMTRPCHKGVSTPLDKPQDYDDSRLLGIHVGMAVHIP